MYKTTMKVLIFLVFSVGCVVTDMSDVCNLAGFYLELGCEPAPIQDTQLCPQSFLCPDLHPDSKKCYYRGVGYEDKSILPQNVILNPCSQACSCRVTDKPRFECASVDCVESFEQEVQQDCIQTYDFNSCCSTNIVCGKDAIAKLEICELDSMTYYEGQAFQPSNTRKTCICATDWAYCKEDLSDTNCTLCRDVNCGLEIYYQDMIMGKCAPIFSGDERGCPSGFQCPSPKSKVVRGLGLKSIGPQCQFGNETLSVGDIVTVDDKASLNCSCKIPPFVTCNRKHA